MPAAPGIFSPLTLPCGVTLKNRLAKSAMSDSLGDGTGNPSDAQIDVYARWAVGGVAVSIIGEVQGRPDVAEKPGNLVLRPGQDLDRFRRLADAGRANDAQLWLQLGHAGALAHPPISRPKGPSALDLPGLTCEGLSADEIAAVPAQFAETAALAESLGFGGVQVHAAHGFLLSQFLSPLFNKRTDDYGGSIENRARLTVETVKAVRAAVSPSFALAIKLNATDQLEGGLEADEALQVVTMLAATGIDLIDVSGGTYFPGAKSASDARSSGPYFLDFATAAKALTDIPVMATGGFKTFGQVNEAITTGKADMAGLARALVVDPDLPNNWADGDTYGPDFPRFETTPEGGVTAWYTMRIGDIAAGRETTRDLPEALRVYEARDEERCATWNAHFSQA